MSTTKLLHSLFQYKAWANLATFAELEKLDATTHAEQLHNALRILNHIYVVDRIWIGHLTATAHGFEATNTAETPTLQALREGVFATDQWYLDYIPQLSEAALAESLAFTFTDNQNGRMTRAEMLGHIVTHGGYHRGAAGRFMLQAGVAPPRDSIAVYLHQSEPQRRDYN